MDSRKSQTPTQSAAAAQPRTLLGVRQTHGAVGLARPHRVRRNPFCTWKNRQNPFMCAANSKPTNENSREGETFR
ncbi:hypothetical protein FH972_026969 [Carpinus fangiana]|uniref:Uncharacterized protein n=1 Tax=Carpinus fangiana TaxID=176857 RepID=A0A5N6L5M7_9ROSI|nr:hypothetical protein FH972_026969 [Carpinus fangiana]